MTREEILKLICDNTGKRINLPNFTIEELEDFANSVIEKQDSLIAELWKDAEQLNWLHESCGYGKGISANGFDSKAEYFIRFPVLKGFSLKAAIELSMNEKSSTQEDG